MTEHKAGIEERLDDVLGSLPATACTASHGRQRLVVSAGGVFVLDPMDPRAATTPVDASALAAATRDRLAENLRWVPFVDWFVVTEHDATASQLPVDLVATTVLEGHVVDEATARRIRALLEFGELSPPWEPGLPDRAGPAQHPKRSEDEPDLPLV